MNEMCDILPGGSKMCDKLWQGKVVILVKNSVTYLWPTPIHYPSIHRSINSTIHQFIRIPPCIHRCFNRAPIHPSSTHLSVLHSSSIYQQSIRGNVSCNAHKILPCNATFI